MLLDKQALSWHCSQPVFRPRARARDEMLRLHESLMFDSCRVESSVGADAQESQVFFSIAYFVFHEATIQLRQPIYRPIV